MKKSSVPFKWSEIDDYHYKKWAKIDWAKIDEKSSTPLKWSEIDDHHYQEAIRYHTCPTPRIDIFQDNALYAF